MARRVVGEEGGGEVGRVQAEVVTAAGPTVVNAVAVYRGKNGNINGRSSKDFDAKCLLKQKDDICSLCHNVAFNTLDKN